MGGAAGIGLEPYDGRDDHAAVPVRGAISQRWTEERVARELESWFAEQAFESWPTYRTFVRGGRKGLHAALMRLGGPRRWAAELGVPVVHHRPGGALSEDAVELALRRLLREHRPERFPTNAWLRRNGAPGLAAAVRRTGGGARWARVLHMPAPQSARWTDELVEAELRRVCAGGKQWPTRAEFERARATGVLRAVYAGHGSHWWAGRLGVSSERLRSRRSETTSRGETTRS